MLQHLDFLRAKSQFRGRGSSRICVIVTVSPLSCRVSCNISLCAMEDSLIFVFTKKKPGENDDDQPSKSQVPRLLSHWPSCWVANKESQGSLSVRQVFLEPTQAFHCQAHIFSTHTANTGLQALTKTSFGPGSHKGCGKALRLKDFDQLWMLFGCFCSIKRKGAISQPKFGRPINIQTFWCKWSNKVFWLLSSWVSDFNPHCCINCILLSRLFVQCLTRQKISSIRKREWPWHVFLAQKNPQLLSAFDTCGAADPQAISRRMASLCFVGAFQRDDFQTDPIWSAPLPQLRCKSKSVEPWNVLRNPFLSVLLRKFICQNQTAQTILNTPVAHAF